MKLLSAAEENFMFDGERDLPVVVLADLIEDESRGDNGHEGLEPDCIPIEDMSTQHQTRWQLSLRAFRTLADVGWHDILAVIRD